jgi:hypothetical protein
MRRPSFLQGACSAAPRLRDRFLVVRRQDHVKEPSRGPARGRTGLEAEGGLALQPLEEGAFRVAWGEPDWLGPIALRVEHGGAVYVSARAPELPGVRAISPRVKDFEGADGLGAYRGHALAWPELPLPLLTTVRAYRDLPVLIFGIEAGAELSKLATGAFERTSVAWPTLMPLARSVNGAPGGLRSYAHQWTEFAIPLFGDAACGGYTRAGHRPPVATPLLFLAPGGRTLLLGSLNHFHEQTIALPRTAPDAADGVRCGWHGDLATVPAGFASELGIWAAPGPRAALEAWCGYLLRRYGTLRPTRYRDDGLGKLSYWTDNGSVYYYRTEPGLDYPATLERVVETLHAKEVPIRSVQIDSWFYPHEKPRPVSAEGASVVPPTGMLRWEPREDVFPDGLHGLRSRVGNLPLTFHSRHFSRISPYFEEHPAWIDGAYAHPRDPGWFEVLMAQAAAWGAITYEQDWLVESFFGIHGLREAPGRARAWQEGLDRAAGEHGLTLQWCMGTPADWLQTVTLHHVTSVRTSGDYRYMFDNGLNWVWFLHGNAFARALGLHPYKDVFLTHGETGLGPGEKYVEAESLLASLSAGPVGIGDRLGHTDREIVLRSCRPDGVLVKPDVPIAACDRCFSKSAFFEKAPLVGEAYSLHPAGRWNYVVSLNAWRAKEPIAFRVELADLGVARPEGAVILYDWRRRVWTRLDADGGWDVQLPFQDFDYRVVCPLLPGEITLFGDVSKWATVGDQRITEIEAEAGELRFDLLGAPLEKVEVRGWSARPPGHATAWCPGDRRVLAVRAGEPAGEEGIAHDRETGSFALTVRLGREGRTRLRVSLP